MQPDYIAQTLEPTHVEKSTLSFKEKFILCLPTQALSLSSVLIHNVYIKMYTDIIGLSPKYVSLIYFIFNIWNMLNDPVFGILLDKKKYDPKRGKYVYVMRVTVPFMIIMLGLMIFASPTWPQTIIFLFLLATLFLYDTAATLFSISAGCYNLLAAPSRTDRVDINIIGQYVGNFISFFATLIPTFLLIGDTKNNHTLVLLSLTGIVILNACIYLYAVINFKDRPELYAVGDGSEEKINLPALWADVKSIISMKLFWCNFFYSITAYAPQGIYFTAYLYFMDYVIRSNGLQATLADAGPMIIVFIIYPLIGKLVKTKGSKITMFTSMLPYILGYIILYQSTSWITVFLSYIFIMLGRQMNITARAPLDAAVIDENERLTGTRKPGLFGAVNAILLAPIGGLQLIIFTSIIDKYGFIAGGGAQSASAILGIRIATACIPILCCLIGIIPLILLPFNLKKEQELSAFSVARRQGIKNTLNY